MSQPEWKLQTAVGRFVRSAVTVPHYFEAYDRSKNDGDEKTRGMRHMHEAARHIKAGTPDTDLVVCGLTHRVELKAFGNTTGPTENQWKRINEIRAAGGNADWANSVTRYGELLEDWGIPLARNWRVQALHFDTTLEAAAAKAPAPKKAGKALAAKPPLARIRRMEAVRERTMF